MKNWKRLTRSELALISPSLKSGWTYSPAPGHALIVTWGHPIKWSGGFRPIGTVFRHIYGRPPWLPGEDLQQLDFCPKTSELRESLRFLWREHVATLSAQPSLPATEKKPVTDVLHGVTVVDDGTLADGLDSAPFDGEGTPCRRTPLIGGGVLQGFLYDTYTGRKAGRGSTGNGLRGSYSGLPGVHPTNLVVSGPVPRTPASNQSGVQTSATTTPATPRARRRRTIRP